MRISRIQIKNFRNFKSLDVRLGEHAVVLGENRVGKTNLLFALRLLLDPSLPDSARQLRLDDFWDGLPRPLSPQDFIEISLNFRDFEGNENLLAVLADHLIKPSPMIAQITYRFQPKPDLGRAPKSEADYEFVMFGGGRVDNSVGYDLRRWMPMDLFPALRDAEADLGRWSRSPLRPLLDRATANVDAAQLKTIANEVHSTTTKIAKLPELSTVVTGVNNQLKDMVGENHAVKTALGFAPTEPERLLRSLQLMVDGGRRGVSEASLGSANVLYLGLKHLEHQNLVDEGVRQHTFLAIEEPEAHLHPHLQRLIYKNYLKGRDEGIDPEQPRTILLTTHSPNVASVAQLSNVVILRINKSQNCTEGYSLANVKLEDIDKEDLERYLDVTRGELFFSKGVILVEGDAEKFLVPTLVKLFDAEIDLDALGITICAIGGVNFAPYVKLLGAKGLNIPFVILTDFDPKDEEISQEDTEMGDSDSSYGKNRVVNQIMQHILSEEDWEKFDYAKVLEAAPEHGVFLNDFTFEIDLFNSGAEKAFKNAIKKLTTNKKIHTRFSDLEKDPEKLEPTQFLKDINSIGKGRVAQRLAAELLENKVDVCPQYIKEALQYLVSKV